MSTDYLNEAIEISQSERGALHLIKERDHGHIATFSTRKEAEHFRNLHNEALDRKNAPTTRLLIARNPYQEPDSGYAYGAYVVTTCDAGLKRDPTYYDCFECNNAPYDGFILICPKIFESLPMFANCHMNPGDGPVLFETSAVFVPVED